MIELHIKIASIDYGGLAQQVVPLAIKKLSASSHGDSKLAHALQGLGSLPASAVKVMLNAMPQEAKDTIALAFLQNYKDEITQQINRFAEDKGISIVVTDIEAVRGSGKPEEEPTLPDEG